jgi:hypothetical protein
MNGWRVIVVAVFGAVALSVSSTPAESPRPNLVFVFTDQQSWDTLGCYGNTQTRTPQLDRFASEGVRFRSCFSPPQQNLWVDSGSGRLPIT